MDTRMATAEHWVGAEDVAAHIRVAKESIYRWIDLKAFPAHRVGRLLRFKLLDVDEWVESGDGDDAPPSSTGRPTEGEKGLQAASPWPRTRGDV